MTGSGSFTLTDAGNHVDTLAASPTGTVNYTDNGTLTVGTVATTNGVTTQGAPVQLTAANGITVNQPITTSPGSGGTLQTSGEVTLNAPLTTGAGNITLNGGGGSSADLNINTAQTFSSSIVFQVSRDIIVAAPLRTTNGGSITLTADEAGTGVGGVWVQSTGLVAASGNVTMSGSALFAITGSPPESVRVDANGSNVQVQAGGTLTLENGPAAPTGAHTIVNGAIQSTGNLDLYGASKIELSSTLTSAGGNVTLHSGVILTGNTGVTSGGGAIAFMSAIDADSVSNTRTLTLSAGTGNLSLAGPVGSSQALGSILVSSANNATFAALNTTGAFTQTAGSGTTTFTGGTVGGQLTVSTGSLALDTATLNTGTTSLTAQNAITFNAGLNAGGNTVTLAATSGGITDPQVLGVTAANLAVTAASGISLKTAVSNLGYQSSQGSVTVANTLPLTVNAVGGLVTSSSSGTTTLTAQGPVTFAVGATSGGTTTVTAVDVSPAPDTNNVTVNPNVTVQATAGDVVLQAGDDIVISTGAQVLAPGGSYRPRFRLR